MVSVTDQKTGASSKDLLDIPNWLATLATSHSPDEVALIRRACETAERVHGGQPRESGEPYLQHVLAVANILIDLRLDHETIAAALSHDVLEDGTVKLELIEHDFGARVARLVDGVAKMRLIHNLHSEGKKEQHQVETLRKMLLAMADDVRVVLIKLRNAPITCARSTGCRRNNGAASPIKRWRFTRRSPIVSASGISSGNSKISRCAIYIRTCTSISPACLTSAASIANATSSTS